MPLGLEGLAEEAAGGGSAPSAGEVLAAAHEQGVRKLVCDMRSQGRGEWGSSQAAIDVGFGGEFVGGRPGGDGVGVLAPAHEGFGNEIEGAARGEFDGEPEVAGTGNVADEPGGSEGIGAHEAGHAGHQSAANGEVEGLRDESGREAVAGAVAHELACRGGEGRAVGVDDVVVGEGEDWVRVLLQGNDELLKHLGVEEVVVVEDGDELSASLGECGGEVEWNAEGGWVGAVTEARVVPEPGADVASLGLVGIVGDDEFEVVEGLVQGAGDGVGEPGGAGDDGEEDGDGGHAGGGGLVISNQ